MPKISINEKINQIKEDMDNMHKDLDKIDEDALLNKLLEISTVQISEMIDGWLIDLDKPYYRRQLITNLKTKINALDEE